MNPGTLGDRTLGSANTQRQLFLLGAGLIMAHHVAGKAVRDGLFLSLFSPAELPKVGVAAALLSVVLALAFSRVLSRFGPMRAVPAAFAAGWVLHLGEFGLLQLPGEGWRTVAVVAVYLHLVGLGAILLSGFWSVANETFDPGQAKRVFGRIAGAGTAGGIIGGLLAERGATWFGAEALLLLLAALHLAAWLIVRRAAAGHRAPPAERASPGLADTWNHARDAFRYAPFLTNLSSLVLIGTVTAALLDFLFKSSAAGMYGKGLELTRFFALYYTGAQVVTFAMQTLATPMALRRFGLGRTIQGLPAGVLAGAGVALLFPGPITAAMARGVEMVLRGSFFRSSYELFFTPVPPNEKRATKLFVDVACDRMGDALGGAVLQTMLVLGVVQPAATPILVLVAALAGVSLWITKRMDGAYSSALEHGLLSRAVALQAVDVMDSTTLAALLHSGAGLITPPSVAILAEAEPVPPPAIRRQDPLLLRLADLRSGIPLDVQSALAPDQPFDAAVVPFAVRLLAWNEGFDSARAFLLRHAHLCVGQLVDALLDPNQDVAVRRRIPQILAYTTSQRAVDGLMEALTDSRFEIRFNVSRALEFLHRMGDTLHFDETRLLAAAESEVSSSRTVWEGRKLLDQRNETDGQFWYLDEVLRDRSNKSLELVFSLLAIPLPADSLKVAFRALHNEDRLLRGLALEFLESRLPPGLASQLRRLVDPGQQAPSEPRPAPVVFEDLMKSHESMLFALRTPPAAGSAGDTIQ